MDTRDLGPERGFLRHRHRGQAAHLGDRGPRLRRLDLDSPAGHHGGGVHHATDVLGARAAAAPDERHAALEQPPRIHAEVLGRGHVDRPLVQAAGTAGVRLRAHRPAVTEHLARHLEHEGRSLRAVHADHVGAAIAQEIGDEGRRQPVDRRPVLAERHLRHDRSGEQGAGRLERRFHLGGSDESLQDQEVDALFQESLDLLLEDRVEDGAQRGGKLRRQGPGRPDRTGDVGGATRGLARQSHSRTVDIAQPVLRAVAPQELAVRPERVRFDNLRARLDVISMDLEHQVGTRKIGLVERSSDEIAALVELRPHRPVEDEGAVRQHVGEGRVGEWHRLEACLSAAGRRIAAEGDGADGRG